MALWGILVTGWLFFGPGASRGASGASFAADAASSAELRSVAVLPFTTRAREGDEDAAIFADGMHDDVLTQLSKIDSLTVISRTSVMQYAGTTKAIPEIAGELGVATILEGGIQRSGDRVRVNVQLIEASTDKHLWAETYDEEMTAANVFAIQSDLAKKIARALKDTLTPETEARIDAKPTESLEAYDLFSRGQYIYWGVRGNTLEGLEEAGDLFEAAIAADSNYAAAWVGLADVYQNLPTRGKYSVEEGNAMAWEAVERALALDPDLAEAHSRRGLLLWNDKGLPEEAERALPRALDLNPRLSKAFQLLGEAYHRAGNHDAAVKTVTRGVTLSDEMGDRMPRDAMVDMLQSWNAPVPPLQEASVKSEESRSDAANVPGFRCARCGIQRSMLPKPPFKGPLGEKIYQHVCENCWKEWIPMGTKVINELGLVLSSPAGSQTYDQYMIEFLQLEDR